MSQFISTCPDGTKFKIGAWKEGYSHLGSAPYDYDLSFSEFIDPQIYATYFSLRNMGIAIDDKIFYNEEQ